MKFLKIITLVFLLISFNNYAQITNSNEYNVLELYNAKASFFVLKGGEIAIDYNVKNWNTDWWLKIDKDSITKKEIITARKNNALFVKAGLTNTKKFQNLNKFDFKKNNGLTFGVSFKHSFKEVYILSENKRPFNLGTFTINAQYSYDKFENFDPTSNTINKETPDVFALSGGVNRYFFNWNCKYPHTLVLALNAMASPKTYNKNSLTNFSELSSGTIVNGSVFTTSNSSFDGKFGIVENDVQTARISFSSGFVPENKLCEKLPYIVPVPHLSYDFFSYSKPKLTYGISIGFLTKALFDEAKKNDEGNSTRVFNSPSFLSIGVDGSNQDGKSSKPNYFISGAITF